MEKERDDLVILAMEKELAAQCQAKGYAYVIVLKNEKEKAAAGSFRCAGNCDDLWKCVCTAIIGGYREMGKKDSRLMDAYHQIIRDFTNHLPDFFRA